MHIIQIHFHNQVSLIFVLVTSILTKYLLPESEVCTGNIKLRVLRHEPSDSGANAPRLNGLIFP